MSDSTAHVVDLGSIAHPGGAAFEASTILKFDELGALDPGFGGDGVIVPPRFPGKCGKSRAETFGAHWVGTPEGDLSELGASGAIFVHGLTGDDTLHFIDDSAGDWVCAGLGDDSISSKGGNQTVFGMGGRDLLRVGEGNDSVGGGSGPDRIFAGRGNDRVWARDGRRDLVRCGYGRDVVIRDRIDRVFSCERVRRA